jgi:hypothetical protein
LASINRFPALASVIGSGMLRVSLSRHTAVGMPADET